MEVLHGRAGQPDARRARRAAAPGAAPHPGRWRTVAAKAARNSEHKVGTSGVGGGAATEATAAASKS